MELEITLLHEIRQTQKKQTNKQILCVFSDIKKLKLDLGVCVQGWNHETRKGVMRWEEQTLRE